ncbi:3-deoxy-D-manno-octulosonic acid transferase [Geobacter pickeringii]|uniref:3-deoxy-D-manno-octulosonic acid transferase n=1 Tax=Geobacter pickeringii TaxID=345632 RepID=A0A0B5BI45_9BACT|nr:3-deoxy-D-manno-octulosonic acid transferase [Geobacter pickeringii]AJE03716.1 3-deoxy-D-manno-octulosonic acid transferase [Geobacter pickeringii]
MVALVYDILFALLMPLIVPFHLYRALKRGRSLADFGERFGFIRQEKRKLLAGKKSIWVHAVSVGETIAAKPLLRELRKRFPHHAIVLSNGTETGRRIAAGLSDVDLAIYFPFDCRLAVGRSLCAIAPSLVVIVETEIWPAFLRAARRRGIPVILANGRISDRSFGRYRKLSWFFRPLLSGMAALCMQSVEDARRIVAIGAPSDTVHATGNLKYDLPAAAVAPADKYALRSRFGIPADSLVFVAGSTHPGEEELLLNAFVSSLQCHPTSVMVLVPRHPERAGEVAELVRARGFKPVLRSRLAEAPATLPSDALLVVDTVGELMTFYRLADVVFVGGSLVPNGGHNLLEPASCGVPLLFGPHTENFREITSLVLQYGAGERAANGEELRGRLQLLFDDAGRRRQLGEGGLALMAACGGGTERHLDVISRILGHEG